MADDVSWECLSCYGAEDYKTPNIDALAAKGIRFNHCYSTPICTTSRVKIMTGQHNSFLPQLQGQKGNPRHWVFCHYQPYWGGFPGTQYVRNQTHKRYRNGSFFQRPKRPQRSPRPLSRTRHGIPPIPSGNPRQSSSRSSGQRRLPSSGPARPSRLEKHRESQRLRLA